jgi:hypothetical protein
MLAANADGRVHNYNDAQCNDRRCQRFAAPCGEWEWKRNVRAVTDSAPRCWCAATSIDQLAGVPIPASGHHPVGRLATPPR